MRILHLIKHCQRACGNVHVAVDLACIQANQHEVIFASAGGDYEELLAAHGVILETTNNSFHSIPQTTKKLIRICKQCRPNIIHAHMMSSAVLGYLASKITKNPTHYNSP
jgi:hypothetical protein